MKIKFVQASEILDSRGNPTIEANVVLEDESLGRAAVPSGASTGTFEAVELRDNDPQRFGGKGVLNAVQNVNKEISKVIIGLEASDQEKIDQAMIGLDGTENKERLGANAILAVSLAVARAAAASEKKELYEYLTKFNPTFNGTYIMPIPQMNIMNGGKHANWSTDIQEYMILPVGLNSTTEAIRAGTETYQQLKKVLESHNLPTTVGDEGGFAPGFSSNDEPFKLMSEAIEKAGYILGKDIVFGIDSASTEFYENGRYNLSKAGKVLSGEELSTFYQNLMADYPIYSFEDIFAEEDLQSFAQFTKQNEQKAQIIGDDLYVTNIKRLMKGIEVKATNSILIKLNQIGSLSETVKTINLAHENHIRAVISHRSGETEDSFIADLSVAMGTGQIKAGAPCRSERTAKYNRLMAIERQLKENSTYFKFSFVNE